MAKMRRALVRGEPARFWLLRNGAFVLRHPRGHDWTEVPVEHLDDDQQFAAHVERLSGKHWISRDALDELLALRDGARS